MKRITFVFTAILFAFSLASCKKECSNTIKTTMFSQYDFTKQIVGDKISVDLIIPPGDEIHGFDPSGKIVAEIMDSKLFIFTSEKIEPWAAKINKKNGHTLNLGKTLGVKDECHSHHGHGHGHDHDHHHHFWTNPETAIKMIKAILNEIISIDKENKDFYTNNANQYIEKIKTTATNFKEYLKTKTTKEIYYAGHDAMGDFSEYFGLKITNLVPDFKPDGDPSSKQYKELIDKMVENKATTLFVEELAEKKVSDTIVNEIKKQNNSQEVKVYELHGYHNITKEQYNKGITYLDLLNQNIENIKKSLND